MLSERNQNNSDARQEILTAIRQNLAKSAPFDAAHREHHAHQEKPATMDAPLVSSADLQKVPLIERFRENLVSIGGNCSVVGSEQEAAQAIQAIIENSKVQRIAFSDSPLVEKTIEFLKTDAEFTKNASAATLFECDLGITSAQWGIAETGTLVLESEKEFNRLTSLVPPVHICLLEAKNMRETLGEILQNLNTGNLSRTVTFITGPSRTSDIELTLAIGVHGPAELHVIVIGEELKPQIDTDEHG